jgi:hypothetical protein
MIGRSSAARSSFSAISGVSLAKPMTGDRSAELAAGGAWCPDWEGGTDGVAFSELGGTAAAP